MTIGVPGRVTAPGAVDLRLVGPALATWAGCLLGAWLAGRAVGPGRIAWVIVIAVIAAALLVRAAAWSHRGARAAAMVAVGTLACLGTGVITSALTVADRGRGPLVELARRSGSATFEGTVTGDPVVRRSRGGPSWKSSTYVLVAVRVDRVTAGGRSWALHQPALVLTSERGFDALIPSQHLRLRGRVTPPRRGDTVSAVILAGSPPSSVSRPSAIQGFAARLRHGLRDAADGLPAAERGLLPGLVVGDTSGLGDDVREDFRVAGMTHLVAVSGANCALVLAVVLALLRRTRLGVRSRAVWAAVALLGFMVLARPSPSVLRAGVMGLLGVVAAGSSRPRATVPALAAAVVVLLLADPDLARSAGFTLSVLATAGLIALAPGWRDGLARRVPARLADAVAVPLAAQVACMPVIAAIAGSISTVAVVANVVALPAVPAATVLGVLTVVLAPVSMPLARIIAHLAGLPCAWLVVVAHVAARVPGASVGWPAGTVGAVTLAAVALVCARGMRRRGSRRMIAAVTAGTVAAQAFVVPQLIDGWPPAGWRLTACDVGQGDALVLSAGPGAAVLIDAGPDPALVRTCLRDLRVDRIQTLFLSHLHADHVEGLPGVLGVVEVDEVVVGPLFEPPAEWARVRRWIADARVPSRQVTAGDRGVAGDVAWVALAPTRVLHGTDSDPNNNSIVLRIDAGGLSLLLMGDAETDEQAAVRGMPGVKVDVLKVAHHGSARQDPRLIAETGARVAVISVGAGNDYGHPSSRTLSVLAGLGMATFRTDVSGSIAVLRRGGRIVTVTRGTRVTARGPPAGASGSGRVPHAGA